MKLVNAELPFVLGPRGRGGLSPHIPTLNELLTVTRWEIAGRKYDIAAIDLVCAAGLPGTENLDVSACLRRLDIWTETVRAGTAKHWPAFQNDPERFNRNPNIYRVEYLCHVLGDDYGIRYNPYQEDREFWNYSDPNNEFICGQLGEHRMGTCASLSKLGIAIGRRLGYPLKFVQVPEHSFFRWDGEGDYFNNEWNGRTIFHHEDAHYKTWPIRWTPTMEREFESAGIMLVSMSPERELAMALVSRAIVLIAQGQFKRRQEVLDLLAAAARIDPSHPGYMAERQKFLANVAIHGDNRWAFATRPDREEAFVIDSPILREPIEDSAFTNFMPGWARALPKGLGHIESVGEFKLPLLTPHLQPRAVRAPMPGRPSMEELLSLDPGEYLRRHPDTAATNILCATGLPNGQDVDLPRQLAELDEMAEFVRRETAHNWHVYRQAPDKFYNSEQAFRVTWMLLCLRKRYRFAYNADRFAGTRFDRTDAADQFIHGLLSSRRTGTCASLPVLAAAVGRRLGYPLKLVRIPQHGFFRWDDGKTKMNFEFGGDGCSVNPDEYYRSWPIRWDDDVRRAERQGHYLSSLTPEKEIAEFLESRCAALEELGRLDEAVECLIAARRFDPVNPWYPKLHLRLLVKWAGVEYGMPFVSIKPRGGVSYRPNIVVTELFPELIQQPPDFFVPVEHWSLFARIVGVPPHVPWTYVVSVGPLFSANWYWNFYRDPAPFRPIEPGRELLDAVNLFRDRRHDPKRLQIMISRKHYDDEPTLFVHRLKFVTQKQKPEKGKERVSWSSRQLA